MAQEGSSADSFLQKRMTRRQAIGTAGKVAIGAVAVAAVAGGVGGYYLLSKSPSSPSSKPNVALTWFLYVGANQGIVETQVLQDYMQQNPNVNVTIDSGSNAATYPQMVAAKKAGQPPVVNAGYMNPATIAQGDLDGMWGSFDLSKIPNAADLYPNFARPKAQGVPSQLAAIGFSYNPNVIKNPPASWADILTPGKYPKQVWWWQGTWEHLVLAAMINGGDVNNIQPGINAWAGAASNLGGSFTSNAQLAGLIAQNEVGIVVGYFPSNTAALANAGLPIHYVAPSDGQLAFPVYIAPVVGESADQLATIEDITNIMVSPTVQANITNATFLAPMNQKTVVPASTAKLIQYSPTSVSSMVQIDWLAYAKNSPNYQTLWNQSVTPKL